MLLKRGRVWHSRIMHSGKLHQKSLRTTSRSQAEKFEAIIRSELLKASLESSIQPRLRRWRSSQIDCIRIGRLIPHLGLVSFTNSICAFSMTSTSYLSLVCIESTPHSSKGLFSIA